MPQDEAELAQSCLEIAQQVREQDVQVDENGKASLIKRVAKDRRISIEDGQMRHGRKGRSVRVDGDIRHVLHESSHWPHSSSRSHASECSRKRVLAEASVTKGISEDLEQQDVCLKELHIDRAYLSSHLVRERNDELEVYCKAWPVREGKYFHKQAFTLDWERHMIRCPAGQEMPFQLSGVVHFPQETCAKSPLKAQCTTSAKGRSVNIHPDEALLIELRERKPTPRGRAQLRERVEARAHPGPCWPVARTAGTLSGCVARNMKQTN